MTDPIRIDPKIADHVDAAIKAGFTVYAVPEDSLRPVGWVALCLQEDGPWAHIQQPTLALDPVQLDVPVKPHKDWGSAVHVDHDGTPEGAVSVLRTFCSQPNVTVRFMTRQYVAKHGVPKVPNWGRKCIERWPTAVKLGRRGTNWTVPQLAGRLEIGDRFELRIEGRDHTTLTVTGRKYGGTNWDRVTLTTKELPEPLDLGQREFVTLLGGA